MLYDISNRIIITLIIHYVGVEYRLKELLNMGSLLIFHQNIVLLNFSFAFVNEKSVLTQIIYLISVRMGLIT